ncbi:AAA family ATPase [Pseudonocardia hydrocarbonoxydans]|uniref:Endonuclease GajA/Old nuclease/RecF-like AAA domain-containing protein n=1 Tax=Pseudonocardia hydrocarbonoxydans TaxID=76726 RepID=A0A4Y3WLY8_9PSEU|nr:AAA family ATPase [Pseudonocardia hydrocarbonoxydans]GEC19070.1 hypothetical protein PHY01_13530 [Pseudonocardia hydrocarbonoxydans]
MKITIQNLGPIRAAEIPLSRLLVFVGFNNTGKSFAAASIHALLSRFARDDSFVQYGRTSLRLNELDPEMTEAANSLMGSKSRVKFDTLQPDLQRFFADHLNESLTRYAWSLIPEIERVTATEATELRRRRLGKAPRSAFRLDFDRPQWGIRIGLGAHRNSMQIRHPEIESVWNELSASRWRQIQLRTRRFQGASRRGQFHLREILRELNFACFQEMPAATSYLPAARSGLMQSQKALSGAIIRQSSLAGIRAMNIPALSGVVAEFLGNLTELEIEPRGDFEHQAERLESELLDGEIVLQEARNSLEVYYKTPVGAYPLSRTSSMISEIAPIVLYLRNIVQTDEMLIIEEPEAHLHPSAQIVLARILVELVNSGLIVALTTHSEYFLQQLSNSMLAAAMPDDTASIAGYLDVEQLDTYAVSAYRFEPSADGTVVEQIPTDRSGIPNASFERVAERLYDEMVVFERRLSNGS